MLQQCASWWDGKTSLDGGAVHQAPKPTGPAAKDSAKNEMFGHLRVRVHNNPEASGDQNKKRTDLVAFNDGCAQHAAKK